MRSKLQASVTDIHGSCRTSNFAGSSPCFSRSTSRVSPLAQHSVATICPQSLNGTWVWFHWFLAIFPRNMCKDAMWNSRPNPNHPAEPYWDWPIQRGREFLLPGRLAHLDLLKKKNVPQVPQVPNIFQQKSLLLTVWPLEGCRLKVQRRWHLHNGKLFVPRFVTSNSCCGDVRKGAMKNVHGGQSGRDASQAEPIKRSQKSESCDSPRSLSVHFWTEGPKVTSHGFNLRYQAARVWFPSEHFASSWKSLALGVLVDLPFFHGLIGVGGFTKVASFSKKTPGQRICGQEMGAKLLLCATETWLNRSVKPVCECFKYRTSPAFREVLGLIGC